MYNNPPPPTGWPKDWMRLAQDRLSCPAMIKSKSSARTFPCSETLVAKRHEIICSFEIIVLLCFCGVFLSKMFVQYDARAYLTV